mgnify:CR=1 FL=1
MVQELSVEYVFLQGTSARAIAYRKRVFTDVRAYWTGHRASIAVARKRRAAKKAAKNAKVAARQAVKEVVQLRELERSVGAAVRAGVHDDDDDDGDDDDGREDDAGSE